jgi:succinate-semialdehyde dehydrogenase/glutarate-semialdehyde dehydrogenase
MMFKKITPMLVDGAAVQTARTLDVTNPATETLVAAVPEADAATLQAALTAAEKGFHVWSQTSPAARRKVIMAYADLLVKNQERLVELLRAETGKPLDNAEYDFGMLVTCLRFFVEEFERLDQPVLHDPDGRFLHYVQRQPLGVVVGMLAWNFPLLNLGYKLGPALAAGCSVIIKPSPLTPLASLEAAHLAKAAGFPDGVINVVTGSDHAVMAALLNSKVPALVTMIGSTRGGLEVMKASVTSVKHFSLELGGNAPVVVYPDADVRAAAHKVVDLKFANSGQVCVSPNRCFVHASVHDEFVTAAKERAASVKMGPLISAQARENVLKLVRNAVADGAQLVCGGQAVAGKGFFMEPTILRNVARTMKTASDEIFGPVLPIIRYTDADDVIALANDTDCGLAAYVFTKDLAKGLRAARDIKAGSVCVNEPHYSVQLPHGGLKQSGMGKDCSRYSIAEYLTLKRVSVLLEK